MVRFLLKYFKPLASYDPLEKVPQCPWFVIRWTFAAVLFIEYARILPFHEFSFSPQGFSSFTGSWDRPNYLGSPDLRLHAFLSNWLGNWGLFLAHVGILLFAAFTLFNFRARCCGAILLILHCLLHSRNEYLFWGWATLIKSFLIYALLSPAFSQTAKDYLAKGPRSGPRAPQDLCLFHVAILYWTVSNSRLDSEIWWDGSAVLRILSEFQFSRVPDLVQFLPMGLANQATWLFWIIELSSSVALLWKPTRKYWIGSLLTMHILLEITTMVGWWNWIMIALLLSLAERESRFICQLHRRFERWNIDRLGVEEKSRHGIYY